MKQLLAFLLLLICSVGYAQQQDSVTICGQVTDYNGQPIDSCSLFWQSPSFNDVSTTMTGKDGHYSIRIPKGKYQSAGGINMATYPHTAKAGLPIVTQHSTSGIIGWRRMDCVHSASPVACRPFRYTCVR